jgi:hypothetical protein
VWSGKKKKNEITSHNIKYIPFYPIDKPPMHCIAPYNA